MFSLFFIFFISTIVMLLLLLLLSLLILLLLLLLRSLGCTFWFFLFDLNWMLCVLRRKCLSRWFSCSSCCWCLLLRILVCRCWFLLLLVFSSGWGFYFVFCTSCIVRSRLMMILLLVMGLRIVASLLSASGGVFRIFQTISGLLLLGWGSGGILCK